MTKTRDEISGADQWNLDSMYINLEEWEKEFETCCSDVQPRWPELKSYQGRLHTDEKTLSSFLKKLISTERKLSKLFTYAHLRHDEEITLDQNKTAFKRISALIQEFQEEVAWFEPELLSLSTDKIKEYLSSQELSEYQFFLEKIVRVKPHTLSSEQEFLVALSGQALQATHRAFSAINDADFNFGKVKNSEGKEFELTHASYGLYLRDQDRVLRKNAFLQLHGKYQEYENTLCELLNGTVQSHLFNAKARKYHSCLQAALFPKNIDVEVYHSLIQAVNNNLGVLHKYNEVRRSILGLDQLHLYDMSVPLTKSFDFKMDFDEAVDLIISSVKPLGSEYQNILAKGLKSDRWTDRYENKNKRSGAYSSGCYDSMPYILMNYKGILRDVFTLAHEAGHSMHSYLSHKNQPYHYGDYSIFVAEVASTFNEDLLIRTLLERAKSKEEKIYLLTQKIDDIRNTMFRQTMFAEFELFIHSMVEKNIPLTPLLLKNEMDRLDQSYFGKHVNIDNEAKIEWARIPHFYYNFYVFQYATGISAALALSDCVIKGDKKEREDYLKFLKGGSSRYPIDILRMAGVDMRKVDPVNAAIEKFGTYVKQLEDLALSLV